VTAQTFTSTAQGSATAPTGGAIAAGARLVHSLYHSFTIPETPEVNDIYVVGYLPKGAKPIGGYLATTDIDTGTETFDMDVGIAANGVDSADPDFFTNAGLLSGDAITDLIETNASNVRLFTGAFPVAILGAKTRVQCLVNAVAAAGGTGTVTVRIDYLMPGSATS
jgi:hypothetical protein